jgi:hypothetical protein
MRDTWGAKQKNGLFLNAAGGRLASPAILVPGDKFKN